MVEHKNEYWGNATIYRDLPPARAYELAAIHMDEILAKNAPNLPDEYVKHVWQFTNNGNYAVCCCCIHGALPDTVTSKPDFKEIPWPTIP